MSSDLYAVRVFFEGDRGVVKVPGLLSRPLPPPDPATMVYNKLAGLEFGTGNMQDPGALAAYGDPDIRLGVAQLFAPLDQVLASAPVPRERPLPCSNCLEMGRDLALWNGDPTIPTVPVVPLYAPSLLGMREPADVAIAPESDEPPADRGEPGGPDLRDQTLPALAYPERPDDHSVAPYAERHDGLRQDVLPRPIGIEGVLGLAKKHAEGGDPFGPF